MFILQVYSSATYVVDNPISGFNQAIDKIVHNTTHVICNIQVHSTMRYVTSAPTSRVYVMTAHINE